MNRLLEWLDDHIAFCEHMNNGKSEAKAAFVLTRHYVNSLMAKENCLPGCLHEWVKAHPIKEIGQEYVCTCCNETKVNEEEKRVYDAYRDGASN